MRPPLNRTPITLRCGTRVTDRAQGGRDQLRRAPQMKRDVRGVAVNIRPQWRELGRERQNPQASGDEPSQSAQFFLRHDERTRIEAAAGVVISKGDVVEMKQGRTLIPPLYIVEIRETAHQQTSGGASLWQFFLSDRRVI